MRIAYVINSVEGGGAALPVPTLAAVMQRAGATVRLFALVRRDGRALPAMLHAGLDPEVRDGGETDHLAALRWLDSQVAAWRPTHIWTSLSRATLLGQLVGLRRRVPVVSWQHAASLKPANRRLLRATQRLSRLWIGDSAAVTRLTAERLGVPPERLMQWSIFRADPHAPRAAPRQDGAPLRIGSLGRLHPVKGYDVLIEALARLGDPGLPVELVIAGDGAERATLERLAGASEVRNVRFAGYCDDARGFLASLDLYVQPSRSEGLCVAAHEAMQAGLPVVASAVGELPYSIGTDCGRTVPPNDPEALAAALREMLSDPTRLAAMGRAARTRVLDRFGPERFEAAGLAVLARMKVMVP